MEDVQVKISFADGNSILLTNESIIFPIQLVKHKEEQFCSKVQPVILGDHYHIHDGYIPLLTTLFALVEYFTVDKENTFETSVYKTSSIVSIKQFEI